MIKRHKRLTEKQERFANLVAEGQPLNVAYGIAYDTNAEVSSPTVKSNALRTAKKPHIEARIEELQANQAKVQPLTHEYVMEKLRTEAEDRKKGTPTSRIRALELIGKAQGMFTDDLNVNFKEERSSDDIKAELTKVISALTGTKDGLEFDSVLGDIEDFDKHDRKKRKNGPRSVQVIPSKGIKA